MKKVLISGGSGLVGTALTDLLVEKGFAVAHLSTRKNYKRKGIESYYWNPVKGKLDPKSFQDVGVVIHLAGAGIADKRWTTERKKVVIDSRVESAKLLTDFMQNNEHQVKRFIGTSAIGYYGDRNEVLTEESSPGSGFLAEVCQLWEASYEAVPLKVSSAILRLGVVLSMNGGALPEMMKTMPFFMGILGSGKQIYSWIHLEDIAGIFLHLIENESLTGTYNAVAPQPNSQRSMAEFIAKQKGVVTLPAPEFALTLALGEMKEVVLNSQNCSASKILKTAYKFKFANLNEALENLL